MMPARTPSAKREQNLAYAKKHGGMALRSRSARMVLEAKDRPCVDCGAYFPGRLDKMSLDHRDPDTKHPRLKGKRNGNIRRMPVALAVMELAKCDAVCLLCHADRTFAQRGEGKIDTSNRSARERREYVRNYQAELPLLRLA